MRVIAATILAATLIVPDAFAQTQAPLPAGKPAGVQHAQIETLPALLALGAVGASIAVLVAVTTDNNNAPAAAAVTTTTTG